MVGLKNTVFLRLLRFKKKIITGGNCVLLFICNNIKNLNSYTDSHKEHVLYFWHFEGHRRFKTILYRYLILIAVIGIFI